MADTQRSMTDLQTLLATNNNKELSAQDLRDFMVSTQLRMSTISTINYSATSNDATVILDASTSAISCVLPSASTCQGKFYAIKAINAGTNKPYISTLVDGAAYTFASSNDALIVGNDGTNWKALSDKCIIVTDYTTPAEFTLSSAATATAYNQTINMVRDGIFEVNYQTLAFAATTTVLEFNVGFQMAIDGISYHTTRDARIGTGSIGASSIINLNALQTLASGNHSISVWTYGGTGADFPIRMTPTKIITKKYY
jgi:hypothetical protein